jgi:phosphatidylserine decarboxylase
MIAPEGWPFVLIPVSVGLGWVILGWPVAGWAVVAGGALSLIVFRDPHRECDALPEVLCAPADGRVTEVETTAAGGLRIVVANSLLNAHVARAPVDARLVEIEHAAGPGRRVQTLWRSSAGWFRMQLSGRANRPSLDLDAGALVRRSERIGLTAPRSAVEVELPATAEPLVGHGDRVRSGETPLARFEVPP